jgi:NAD(P)-dependent dehydrogenase (short-subunit alcohol dehydrogenase family)
MGLLTGRVALVTGASRGIGRGIAQVLGEQGATVYVTGRTVEPGDHPLPGTLGDTAAAVEARGGRCIPVAVDHGDDCQVEQLFEQIRVEQDGQLDLLVNNVMAIPDALTQTGSFWEKPLSAWEMMDVGLRSSFVAARLAAQLMVPQRQGLIVGLSGYVGVTYTYDVVFGTCKTAMDRMSRDMGIELKPHNVASLSLWQGFTYTERARKNLETVEGMARDLNSAVGSSVEFPGRVVAALLADPDVMNRTGGTFISAELAEHYGITDIDGRVIPSLRQERGAPIWNPV